MSSDIERMIKQKEKEIFDLMESKHKPMDYKKILADKRKALAELKQSLK